MFCLNYYPHEKYLNDADQLKIKYRPADRTLEDFLKTHQHISIVIDVSDVFEETDATLLKALHDKYSNFKISFDFNNKEHLSRAEKYQIPHFFLNPVTSFDQLHGLIQYHPTDMYICEEMGFYIFWISKLLHENNIKVRVFPNICQSSFAETPSIKTFFIRPEDVSIYSNYVDIFELVSDKDRQKVLFKIYKQQKWFGKLQEVISSFKDDVDNRCLMSAFGNLRTRCKKRCMYNPNGCRTCDRFVELANSLKQNRIIVKRAEKKS